MRIVIVGGVAGGASAAARARRMDEHAQIVLLEKDEHVSFANCGLPYYIGGEIEDRDKLLVATPQRFRAWFNIDVRTGHEAMVIDRGGKTVRVFDHHEDREYDLPYDKLILAPGAEPIRPPIAGLDAPNVFSLRNIPDADRIKVYVDQHQPRRAVVVGAGYIGLEMVEMLKERGLEVALVELLPQVLPPLDPEMAHIVQEELERQEVELHIGNGLKGFRIAEPTCDGTRDPAAETVPTGEAVRAVVLQDETEVAADLVILGIGVRPKIKLAVEAGLDIGETGGIAVNDYQQTSDPDIYAVGDACEYKFGPTGIRMRVALAGPANKAGRVAGHHAVTSDGPAMPTVQGTSIVRVFNAVAAGTGLSEKLAAKFGVACEAVCVEGQHHVGYYPGAQAMVLKVIFEPDTGRLLGAQAVGGEGVDKRIDVVAALIAMNGTIHDLADLDLTYAPPFGHARDPLHQAAYVAENHLRGLSRNVPPRATQNGASIQWVDVRTDKEWQAGHLENAVWIPLHELRDRLGELDPTRPIVTVCRSGKRAYYAARALRQNGFTDVGTLCCGMLLQQHLPAKTK